MSDAWSDYCKEKREREELRSFTSVNVPEVRERRYTILKEADLTKYCTDSQLDRLQNVLDDIQTSIALGRVAEGKRSFNSYIVINVDEPYRDEIVEVMKRNGHW